MTGQSWEEPHWQDWKTSGALVEGRSKSGKLLGLKGADGGAAQYSEYIRQSTGVKYLS